MMHILKNSLSLIALFCMVLSCTILVEEDVTNEIVETVFPTDSAVVYEGDVEFKWLPVFGASGYELLIVSPNFATANKLAVDTVLEDVYNFETNLTPNTYEWMITGVNSGYSSISVTKSFEVVDSSFYVDVSDVIPFMRTPVSGQEIMNDSTVLFNWEPIDLVDTYDLLVVTNTLNNSTFVVKDTVLTDINQLQLILYEGPFTWSLTGSNAFSETQTATGDFTVAFEEVEEEIEDTETEDEEFVEENVSATE